MDDSDSSEVLRSGRIVPFKPHIHDLSVQNSTPLKLNTRISYQPSTFEDIQVTPESEIMCKSVSTLVQERIQEMLLKAITSVPPFEPIAMEPIKNCLSNFLADNKCVSNFKVSIPWTVKRWSLKTKKYFTQIVLHGTDHEGLGQSHTEPEIYKGRRRASEAAKRKIGNQVYPIWVQPVVPLHYYSEKV